MNSCVAHPFCWSGSLRFRPNNVLAVQVTEFVEVVGACVGVEIYSSKTAVWILKESRWGERIRLCSKSISVFLYGFMHMLEYSDSCCGYGGKDMKENS